MSYVFLFELCDLPGSGAYLFDMSELRLVIFHSTVMALVILDFGYKRVSILCVPQPYNLKVIQFMDDNSIMMFSKKTYLPLIP